MLKLKAMLDNIRAGFRCSKAGQVDAQVQVYREILDRMAEFDLLEGSFFHLPTYLPAPLAMSGNVEGIEDAGLVARIISEYQRQARGQDVSEGFWNKWTTGIKGNIHEALLSGDTDLVTSLLRNPASNCLFRGFEAISAPPQPVQNHVAAPVEENKFGRKPLGQNYMARRHCDALLSLADAVGARRLDNPEVALAQVPKIVDKTEFKTPLAVDSLVTAIEEQLGVTLDFPNPFPREYGLASRRGIMSHKAILSVYQGWRIAQEARGNPHFKVLEIGAGLGRAAYYARLFGVKNYTIVDIPMTNVAQSYNLGRVLGEESVLIGSETKRSESGLRILSTVDFADHQERYDMIFNCDSMTEMPRRIAQEYWDFARNATRRVFSINHEHNVFTMRDLYKQYDDVRVERQLCPVRRGYAEEMISW